MDILGIPTLFHLIAWVGTGAAFIFLILMFVGLDDVLDGWFIQRIAVAFACGFGWTGVILINEGWSTGGALALSFLVGLVLAGLLLGAVLGLKKLADSSPEELSSLVGQTGEVVASIDGESEIKVKVLFQGRLQEMMAIRKTPEPLPTGSPVKIEHVIASGKLVVSSLK
jgi:hypothetical protein